MPRKPSSKPQAPQAPQAPQPSPSQAPSLGPSSSHKPSVCPAAARRAARPELPAVGSGKRGANGHIAYLLRQAQGAVRQALDAAFVNAGLTSPQFLLLTLLDAYPGASGAELARLALLTPQTVNLVVRNLERDGLLEKSVHETHGRVLRLALTASGQHSLRECRRRADAVEQQLLALLDPKLEPPLRQWLSDVARQTARITVRCG
jgi:DNA-binding MarR family transcriptional regulator